MLPALRAQDKLLKSVYAGTKTAKALDKFHAENGDLFLGIPGDSHKEDVSNAQNLLFYYYLRAKINFNSYAPGHLEDAYSQQMLAVKHLNKFHALSKSAYDQTCSQYKLCEETVLELGKAIEDSLYAIYTREKDIYQLESFLQKFPFSKYYDDVLALRENKIIDDEIAARDRNRIQLIIKKFPNSSRLNELKTVLEDLDIDEAIQSKDSSKLLRCMQMYPHSKRLNEIRVAGENMQIEQALAQKDLDKLQKYLQWFPANPRKQEMEKGIEDILVDRAIASMDTLEMKRCLRIYPNNERLKSTQVQNAVAHSDITAENQLINEAIASRNSIKIKELMIQIGPHPRRAELVKALQNAEIDEAINSKSKVLIQLCIDSYPNTERMGELKTALKKAPF